MTSARPRLPAVILISGRGSNMHVIAEHALAGKLAIDVRAVISDRAQAPGLATARMLGLSTEVVAPAPGIGRPAYDLQLAQAVQHHAPQLVLLAGFLRILSRAFVEEFVGRMLNIHPSLLPDYRGLDTHARVLDARERQHGASVHFVTPELDAGPVVIQGRLEIRPNETEDMLAARVLRIEHQIYPRAIGWFADGRLDWNGGNIRFDGEALAAPKIIEEQDL